MGLLINGTWHDQWYDTSGSGGRFKRQDSGFRNWITADGAPGLPVKGVSQPRRVVITCTFRSPAPGPIGP